MSTYFTTQGGPVLTLSYLSSLRMMTGDRVTARAGFLKLKCVLPQAQHASDDLVFEPRALYVGIPGTACGEAVLYLGGGIMSVLKLKDSLVLNPRKDI